MFSSVSHARVTTLAVSGDRCFLASVLCSLSVFCSLTVFPSLGVL